MTVTALKSRRKHLIAVEIDGEDVLLDEETVLTERLKIGEDISDSRLDMLKYKSEFNRAKNKALWLMSRRDYAKSEMINKLKPDFDHDACEEAVELLCESGLIDDERFARFYTEDLVNLKGMSRNGVKRELIKKGIDRELACQIAEELDCDETPAIIEIIQRKYANSLEDEKLRRRMVAALVRKGYGYDDIRRAINEYTEREL